MNTPCWGGTRQKTENENILLVYRLPEEHEVVIFFKNPASKLRRQEQLAHLKKSLKITEEIWKDYKAGLINADKHGIEYEDPEGNPSGRRETLSTVLDRIKTAGREQDYKNVAAELLKGDGYLSYIPIVQKCFLKKGATSEL